MSLEIRQVEPLYEGYVSLMMATLAAPDGTTVRREIELWPASFAGRRELS